MSRQVRISRRRFLQSSAAAGAAGILAPHVIPRSALADPSRPGANDRIGIGYVGFGRRAPQIGLTRDAATVAVADVNLPHAEAIAGRYQAKAFQDYRAMLDLKEVDAVIVATPDHWHALPSIQACQAGKHVFCEKPLTLTISEGRMMAAAARKYQRVFQTGSQQRSDAKNRFGCELVRNGRIGKVHTVLAANFPSPWLCGLPGEPVPAGLDWDAWCGPTEPRPYHRDLYPCRAQPGWLSFRDYSGGEMTGWGSHGFDQVQWALGADDTGPVEIWAEGEPFDPPTYTQPESRARGDAICSKPNVFMRYACGAVMRLGGGPGGGAVFIGERGRITIDRSRVTADPVDLLDEPLPADAVRLDVSNDHVQNWFDCIRSGRRPIADVEIGHRSATVCHLGNIARWLGRKAVWDPVREIFPGDDEANQYLDRPRRKPYDLPETI